MSDTSTPPGWYPDVERAGGERWWDGMAWTEHRRPAGGVPPAPPSGQPPTLPSSQPAVPPPGAPSATPGAFPPAPGGGLPGSPVWGDQPPGAPPTPQGYVPFGTAPAAYPESSKAGWALGLSIFGLFCCAMTSIIGLVLGRNEMTAIDAGRADPSKRGLAQAAFIVGIIVVSLSAAAILLGVIGTAVGQ